MAKIIVSLLLFYTTVFANNVDFDALLSESKMVLEVPENVRQIASNIAQKQFEYQDLNIIYSINPIARITIDYEDPHNSAPHPNDLFAMLFNKKLEYLIDKRDYNSYEQVMPLQMAKEKWGATWVKIVAFNLDQAIFKHSSAMLIAMHKNDLSDAYILFTTDNLQKNKSIIKKLLNSLRFQDA